MQSASGHATYAVATVDQSPLAPPTLASRVPRFYSGNPRWPLQGSVLLRLGWSPLVRARCRSWFGPDMGNAVDSGLNDSLHDHETCTPQDAVIAIVRNAYPNIRQPESPTELIYAPLPSLICMQLLSSTNKSARHGGWAPKVAAV
jgi:hypothetical protein